jgi:hypothetical protein
MLPRRDGHRWLQVAASGSTGAALQPTDYAPAHEGGSQPSTHAPLEVPERHQSSPLRPRLPAPSPLPPSQLVPIKQTPPALTSQDPPNKIPICSIYQRHMDLLQQTVVDCDGCALNKVHYQYFVTGKLMP